MYRNDLRENKNYFELEGGSCYLGFELPRVKLQQMYEENPGKIDFGSSSREFRVSKGRVIGSQLYTVLRTRANHGTTNHNTYSLGSLWLTSLFLVRANKKALKSSRILSQLFKEHQLILGNIKQLF